MLYFANPCVPEVVAAMMTGALGFIDTPAQGNARPDGVTWCADNGCFSAKWDADKWWAWLQANAHRSSSCAFAVAPDVVADHEATTARSLPWMRRIRALGYPVAFVAQNGARDLPWDQFDALFLGGLPECLPCGYIRPVSERKRKRCPICGRRLAEWKLSLAAGALVREARNRGKHVHMGRVNSFRRIEYAAWIGCDSADGTYLTFGPDINLPKLLGWLYQLDTRSFLFLGDGVMTEGQYQALHPKMRNAIHDMRRWSSATPADLADAVMPIVVRELAARDAKIAELRGDREAASVWSLAEWEDWSNEIALRLPDDYDGDESQESLILVAVEDLVERLAARDQVIAQTRALAEHLSNQVARHERALEECLRPETRARLAARREIQRELARILSSLPSTGETDPLRAFAQAVDALPDEEPLDWTGVIDEDAAPASTGDTQ